MNRKRERSVRPQERLGLVLLIDTPAHRIKTPPAQAMATQQGAAPPAQQAAEPAGPGISGALKNAAFAWIAVQGVQWLVSGARAPESMQGCPRLTT